MRDLAFSINYMIDEKINSLVGYEQELMEAKDYSEKLLKQITAYDPSKGGQHVDFMHMYADYAKCTNRVEELEEMIPEMKHELDGLYDMRIKIFKILNQSNVASYGASRTR